MKEYQFNVFIERFQDLINQNVIVFYEDKYQSNNITKDILEKKKNLNDINSIVIDWVLGKTTMSKDVKKPKQQILKFGFTHVRFGTFIKTEDYDNHNVKGIAYFNSLCR